MILPQPKVVKSIRNSCKLSPNGPPSNDGDDFTHLARYRLDADAEILFRGPEPTVLGQHAVALLRMLLERPGEPVSKDALIKAGWPGRAIEDSNLTVQIAALRRIVGEGAGGASWIETLPRRGYRYVGPVVATVYSPAATIPRTSSHALPNKPSVAVLPFSNLCGDPEQEYFSDGIVEDIVAGLSRIKWLFVVARNSSFAYKGKAIDVTRVGRELAVRYILLGSLRKHGSRVRISAQMIEAETGGHIWTEHYDRPLDDIFALQDEIALSVVGAIEPTLRRAEVERVKRKRPENFDAYDLVLQAQPDVDFGIPERVIRALVFLERALGSTPIMLWRTPTPPCAITASSCGVDCVKKASLLRSATRRPLSCMARTTR